MILGLNLLLIGGGIALTLEYLHKRDRAARGELSSTVASSDPASSDPVFAQEAVAVEQVLMDAGTVQRRVLGDADAAGQKGEARDPGRDTIPTPTREADAGAALQNASGVDAGQNASSPVASPEDEAQRVRVLAAQISLVVESHQGQLKRCYESASKVTTPDKPIEGRIDVRFSVQGDGSASSVRTSANDTGSASLENCLLGLVRSWTFPASGGEALDFVWPFEFQAPK